MKHSGGVRLTSQQLQRNVKAQVADGRIFLIDVRNDAGLELLLAPDDWLVAEPEIAIQLVLLKRGINRCVGADPFTGGRWQEP